jgi:NAD(P)H-dependent flavin oxidoreductase YrpB (nitropropane dioxygenase family)
MTMYPRDTSTNLRIIQGGMGVAISGWPLARAAVLAGVDHILGGASSPAELPALLDRRAENSPAALPVRVQRATSPDGDFAVHFDPRTLFSTRLPDVRRPGWTRSVASVDLARTLAAEPATCPDAFVVEGHPRDGHSAPPRGSRQLADTGQPVYDQRDEVASDAMAECWAGGQRPGVRPRGPARRPRGISTVDTADGPVAHRRGLAVSGHSGIVGVADSAASARSVIVVSMRTVVARSSAGSPAYSRPVTSSIAAFVSR